jgi:hypothetical protein
MSSDLNDVKIGLSQMPPVPAHVRRQRRVALLLYALTVASLAALVTGTVIALTR